MSRLDLCPVGHRSVGAAPVSLAVVVGSSLGRDAAVALDAGVLPTTDLSIRG